MAISFAGCGHPKDQLNLFIWSEYLDPKIIAEFSKEFHCEVNVDFFEDPDSMIAKLVAGGSSSYDIVVPSDTTLPAMIHRGLLAQLRPENIPNLKHLSPQFTNAPFDPGNRYSVPLDWGTCGIFLRKADATAPDQSWSLLFDATKTPGPFVLMDDARVTIGAALRYLGYSINSVDPKELAAARDLLIATKKRSLGFEGGAGCKNRVLVRDAVLTIAYNGDAIKGMKEDPGTAYFVPREGSNVYVDVLSIPVHAPHRDLAEKFINFMLEPKISAEFAERAQQATANMAAVPLVAPATLTNSSIFPPAEIMNRLEYANDLGDKTKLYDELWTQIKAK